MKNKSKKHKAKSIKQRSRKQRVVRVPRVLCWSAAIFLFCALLFVVYFFGFRSTLREDVSYQVRAGAGVSAVARDLSSAGIIPNESAFRFFIAGFGGRVQMGFYDIPAGARPLQIAQMLSRGEIASVTVTIPEGLTVRQIVAVLDANQFLTGSACDGNFAGCPKDGELFPDTYRVAKGTNRAAVMQLMQNKMAEIEKSWVASGRPKPAPLKDWNEIITLASIVQKETPKVSEMPTVASVYINRLRKKMRLQADPTVVYAITNQLGDMRGNPLFTGHLKTDSPYNTYVYYGLPPAPIANVGRDAIRSVLNPADTNYLFFVADGTGGHAFARDLDEHNTNRAKWREIKANSKEQKANSK